MRNLSCSGWNAQFSPREGPKVHESVLISGLISNKDALLVAIPFGLILLVQFFRLDTLVAAARRPKQGARRFCGPDAVGDLVLTDPDGRAVQSRRVANSPRLASRGASQVVEARIESPEDRS